MAEETRQSKTGHQTDRRLKDDVVLSATIRHQIEEQIRRLEKASRRIEEARRRIREL